MRVRYDARTHPGRRREINQDAYGIERFGEAILLIVCDGMGGHAAGEVASNLAVATIIETFDPTADPTEALRAAFAAANARVYQEGHGTMGTTGVAALLADNHLYLANVGDSRAYLIREGRITQLSRDHSLVSDQVAAGLMTPEEARTSMVRNIITRALGHSASVEVDVFSHPLQPGDTVLLSTDGLHGMLTDEEIASLAVTLPPEQAVERLVERANEEGGIDNITVVIARIDDSTQSADAAQASSASAAAPLADAPEQSGQDSTKTALAGPAPPTERPLSRLGLILAVLTVVILIGVGTLLWAMPGAPTLPLDTPTPATPFATATSTTTSPREPAPQ